jgi:cytokinin riboside 5'-monophosphate phosphoribohydrolase
MKKTICVYSSSSNNLSDNYFMAAKSLGAKIASKGWIFLFGGGTTGLMGEAARSVKESNGELIGVIPKALNIKGIAFEQCDRLIETKTMRERKGIMDEMSDAFIALPGGFGTLEELLEIITLKQLKYHSKPVVIINTDNYYTGLLDQFDRIIDEGFGKEECRLLYYLTDDVDDAVDYIENYKPFETDEVWLTGVE